MLACPGERLSTDLRRRFGCPPPEPAGLERAPEEMAEAQFGSLSSQRLINRTKTDLGLQSLRRAAVAGCPCAKTAHELEARQFKRTICRPGDARSAAHLARMLHVASGHGTKVVSDNWICQDEQPL